MSKKSLFHNPVKEISLNELKVGDVLVSPTDEKFYGIVVAPEIPFEDRDLAKRIQVVASVEKSTEAYLFTTSCDSPNDKDARFWVLTTLLLSKPNENPRTFLVKNKVTKRLLIYTSGHYSNGSGIDGYFLCPFWISRPPSFTGPMFYAL